MYIYIYIMCLGRAGVPAPRRGAAARRPSEGHRDAKKRQAYVLC